MSEKQQQPKACNATYDISHGNVATICRCGSGASTTGGWRGCIPPNNL